MRSLLSAPSALIPLNQHLGNPRLDGPFRAGRDGESRGASIAPLARRMRKTISSRRLRTLAAGAIAVLALLGLGGAPAAIAQQPQAAPKVALRTTDGRPFPLESARGEVVVLDFWASWCVPCRTSVPFFDSLQERYKERGVRVLGLTLEDNDVRNQLTGVVQA